ncbi:MAG: hypothetical protein SGPRY_014484, partial [Prymnesium sp.]
AVAIVKSVSAGLGMAFPARFVEKVALWALDLSSAYLSLLGAHCQLGGGGPFSVGSLFYPWHNDGRPAEGTKFVEQLLAFDFAAANWLNSPGGLAAWYKAKKGVAFAEAGVVNPIDMYTSKEVVENLGEFVHQILVAMGASQSVRDVELEGYTFRDWTRLYAEHLEMTLTLPTLKLQYEHLDACHGLYLAALRKIGARFCDIVMGASVTDKTLEGGLLRLDEEPISLIFRKRASREIIADLTSELGGLLPGFNEAVAADPAAGSSSNSAQLFVLPKRSSRLARRGESGMIEHEGGAKRRRMDDGPSVAAAADATVEPGSLESTFQWLNSGKELHISGLVWKIEALGRRLGIPASAIWSKCWPYLLSRRGEANKRGLCSKFGRETGHKHAKDTAHVTRPVIDILNLSTDHGLCRYATEAEAEALAEKNGGIGSASSRFRGRGSQGREIGWTPGRLPLEAAEPKAQVPPHLVREWLRLAEDAVEKRKLES